MKSLLALLIFTVLSALLAIVHNRSVSHQRLSPVAQPLLASLAPGQRLATRLREKAESLLPDQASPAQLAEENKQLKATLEKTQAVFADEKRLRAENERLTRLLGLHTALPASLAARVIAAGGSEWTQAATLDRGSLDGVRPKDVVVTDSGVVGQLTGMIGPGSSIVLFLTDPASGISVRTRRNGSLEGVVGVVRGEGKPTLTLRYLDKAANVKKGDDVETSGMGGIFPPGLYIGKVVSVQTDISGTGRTARVKPSVDFDHLQEALILKRSK